MSHLYYIDKRTGTSSDINLAVGFAKFVQSILYEESGNLSDQVFISDKGACYSVEIPVPITDVKIECKPDLLFMQHLDTANQEKVLGEYYGQGFSYELERQKRDIYRAKLRELPPEARSMESYFMGHPALEQLAESISPPDEQLPLYNVISDMNVVRSFNDAVLRWRKLSLSPELLHLHIQILHDLFTTTPNPLAEAIKQWKKLSREHKLGESRMTMLQIINPTTGKGANRTKANDISVGSVEEFWLLEFLKFVGFFALAHPQRIINSKDRKTYILRPRELQFSVLKEVIRTFRNVLWPNTPAKIDVMAVLQLTRVLVEHEKAALQKESGKRPSYASVSPADRIHGFDVAFYKHMGSAFAVMNVASLNVPEWVPPVTSIEEADSIIAILKEHIAVINSIRVRRNEERAEEYELLQRYRNFISGRDIEAFLDFAGLFASYASRKIERGEYIHRFQIDTLKGLMSMTKKKFTDVIENQGFQNVANAIRRATVSLQYQKVFHARNNGQKPEFEIRYGLAQDLVRSANDADGFITSLGDFIAKYNNETARKYELSGGKILRTRVTEDDLTAIVRLLDEHKPKTIAQLLVMFGSAKAREDPKDSERSFSSNDIPEDRGE